MLEITDLVCGYGNDFCLDKVNINIEEGAFTGIIGPNGSGKSTLFKAIASDIPIRSGSVRLAGKETTALSLKERARMLSVVTQFQELSPITVEEFVLMGRTPYRGNFQFFNSREDYQIVNYFIELTGITHLRHKRITELSGGEQQMASIASALAQEPKLLLLDEATSHLDITHQIRIMNLLQELNETRGLTIAMIIHDLSLAGEFCSNLVMMKKGKVYDQGTPKEVLTYQNIEAVYETVVVVNSNPISNNPVVFPIAKRRLDECKMNMQPQSEVK